MAAIAVVLAVALIKPWGAGTSAPELATAVGTPVGPPVPATNAAVRPTPTADALSLETVSDTLAAVRRGRDTALVMSLWRPDPVRVPYREAAPGTAELGTDCTGGALLGAGTEAIGVRLPRRNQRADATDVVLTRLFDGQPAVPLPVVTERNDADGVLLIRSDEFEWSAGHYALTFDLEETPGAIAFCIGHMIRLVDYSLITFVPEVVDSAAARNRLLRQVARR